MEKTLHVSDSLIGSLCREVEYVRNRYKNIKTSLLQCKNLSLKKRLGDEIDSLKQRIYELKQISRKLTKGSEYCLSISFFHALCNRPIE